MPGYGEQGAQALLVGSGTMLYNDPPMDIRVVEQIVPSRVCFACDVCCRFPERDSPLRPYFTREEIQAAVARGISPDAFPDHAGSKVAVVPHGEGYRCPAFQPETGQCGIYEDRPLDCRLYPVAVMWDRDHADVVMGWDSKCPFIRDNLESAESLAYVERTAALLESEDTVRIFLANPQLIGAYQDDVIVLRRLNRLTQGLQEKGTDLFSRGVPRTFTAESKSVPFSLADRPRFEDALAAHAVSGDPLAAYSFPFHLVWQGLLRYEWTELEGHLCLFACNQDGSFLALPPIGPDPCGPAMAKAFELLSKRNRTPALTRIENAPESLAARCREKGYRVAPKGPDYVYRRAELVALRGNRYKSQRVAYNHCVAHAHLLYRPFRPDDAGACLALFQQWRQGVKYDGASDLATHLAADAEHAHRNGLTHAADSGLIGRVVEVEGRIAAYTFGYPLNATTFCILFEIADRHVKGLGAYIFREFCRELESYELINTMDDSGVEGLRRAKFTYHPLRLVESYIVSPA
ncbi:MAG: DUF2156 domain-containing protein [Nitrospirae bacterium]|nr:MAG: DUF2156 domain-containing protein [Nitrospirota bacterium]